MSETDFKPGDRITLEIDGLGIGYAEIVEHDGVLYIYDPTQGYYPLELALKREDMAITKIEEQ